MQERQRHPTEVRRRLIIDTARDLIADKGLFNVLVRDISQACAVSPGTITYHFRGLDELLMEVVKAETTEFYLPLTERARRAATPRQALMILLEGMFRSDQNTRRHWLIWLDFWSAAARDDQYGQWMNDHYRQWRETLAAIVATGLAEGTFRGADPAAFALEMAAVVDGLAIQCYGRRSSISVTAARGHVTSHATRLLEDREPVSPTPR